MAAPVTKGVMFLQVALIEPSNEEEAEFLIPNLFGPMRPLRSGRHPMIDVFLSEVVSLTNTEGSFCVEFACSQRDVRVGVLQVLWFPPVLKTINIQLTKDSDWRVFKTACGLPLAIY